MIIKVITNFYYDICYIDVLKFQIIDKDINPNVDKWEKEGQYPAKKIYKKLAEAGLLGITRSTGKIE